MTPYTGRCYCGKVQYRVNEEPMTIYACHCTDCQKRSGSAFGLSMWVNTRAIEVTAGEAHLHESTGPDGSPRNARVCGNCGVRLWSEPTKRPGLAVMRPGTLDDTSGLVPMAHIWTRSAQKWFTFPEGVPRYEQNPPSFADLLRK
jgi:hypothetical protein